MMKQITNYGCLFFCVHSMCNFLKWEYRGRNRTMTLFVFGISLLGMITGVVFLILGLIKKKKLKGGIVLGVSVLLFFVSLIMPAPEGSKEKVEVASKTQEELNKEKEVEQAKKEEEAKEKAVAEQKAKLKEEQAVKEKEEQIKSQVTETKPKEETKPVKKEVIIEPDSKEEIKKIVKNIVSTDLSETKINDLTVNNYQGEENKYIVLPHLKWEVENSKKTTVEMLEMYSDNIAAKLYEQPGIEEITVFWEVPYHLEGENIAKFNYTRTTTGMAKNDKWLAPVLK